MEGIFASSCFKRTLCLLDDEERMIQTAGQSESHGEILVTVGEGLAVVPGALGCFSIKKSISGWLQSRAGGAVAHPVESPVPDWDGAAVIQALVVKFHRLSYSRRQTRQ